MPLPQLIKDGKIDIELLRKEYLKAIDDEKSVYLLLNSLAKFASTDALVIAYQACLETLKAKQVWNPLEKLALAKQSQDTFARAIEINPNHLEIRFLRYSIQLSLPHYLYLSKDLAEDKSLIIKLIQEIKPTDMSKENLTRITHFMLTSGQCTPAEREILKKSGASNCIIT
jgi:hypothetical protein